MVSCPILGAFSLKALFINQLKNRVKKKQACRPLVIALALTFSRTPVSILTGRKKKSALPRLKTQLLKINPEKVGLRTIRSIATVLSQEMLAVYPTDTFYGLGAVCTSRKAIARIYRLKKREASMPLPVIISDLEQARDIAVEIPPLLYSLAASFWPGPLTLVLKAAPHLPAELLGRGQTIGMRIPASPWLRKLVGELRTPLIATSANISGEGEIMSAEEALDVFKNRVDLIVDGGVSRVSAPSTVLDLSMKVPVLIRAGAVPKAKLRTYLRLLT